MKRVPANLKRSLKNRLDREEEYRETIGDIPLFSLRRIRRMMLIDRIDITPELNGHLDLVLDVANRIYRAESGNRKWKCLTPNNLLRALEALDDSVKKTIDDVVFPTDQVEAKEAMRAKLHKKREQSMQSIEEWFERHFDDLLYESKANIPPVVIDWLRTNLIRWFALGENRFGDEIEQTIIGIAREQGLDCRSPEEAWRRMGGKIFLRQP